MTDILLVFPPQWSPFQPALSLPSLSAWLKRAGHTVTSLDLNVLFYQWLLSDECAVLLCDSLAHADLTGAEKAAYGALFGSAGEFRDDIDRLRGSPAGPTESAADFAMRNYLAIQSFESYLDALSTVAGAFTVSPYHFVLRSGNLQTFQLERHIDRPPELISRFLRTAVDRLILPTSPSVVGLSCIGQEQLYFTLLLGRMIKETSDLPVLVGGTIFSRIFERGALPLSWFDRYFDVIVRNEGEKPAERILANLKASRPMTRDVPGVVYRDGPRIVSSEPSAPLSVAELPIPDFEDLPLGEYISPEVTLPLLSARGCYWGKCEFCHHGMVYGEKYAPYKTPGILETVTILADRYNVRHFAFNDEAIPPTTARGIARSFPPHEETGWTFTGLMKFEPSYSRADFDGMYRAGFRSLYVGLESASERVLELMRKRSKRSTVVGNLTDATRAGIWMHCFLFFGFPGEREEDAQETYDFIVENSDIVSSFGAGTFSLEHNAPIFKHLADFGVAIATGSRQDIDVYYEYEVAEGVSAGRALEWQRSLSAATRGIPNYVAASWVPRELLLCMLSAMTPQDLRQVGLTMRECGGFPSATRLSDITSRAPLPGGILMVINRSNGRALRLAGAAPDLFDLCCRSGVDLGRLQRDAPVLFDKLAFDVNAGDLTAPAAL